MANGEEFIWYASYGSNILEERFLCFLSASGLAQSAFKNSIKCLNPI
jgi:hypothetical protein